MKQTREDTDLQEDIEFLHETLNKSLQDLRLVVLLLFNFIFIYIYIYIYTSILCHVNCQIHNCSAFT